MAKKIIFFTFGDPFESQNNLGNFNNWGCRVGYEIIKHTDEFVVEDWTISTKIKKTLLLRDQLVHRIFPVKKLPLELFEVKKISLTLLKELKKESKRNEILIYINTYSSYFGYLISFLLKNFPIVGQHHGSTHPLKLLTRRPYLFWLFPLLIFEELIEFLTYRYIDQFYVLDIQEKRDLVRIKKVLPQKVKVQNMGVDFEYFTSCNKIVSRKKLNLPLNSKIIIFIGQFNKAKNVDKVISAYNSLKKSIDVDLVLVGGQESQEHYALAQESTKHLIGRITQDMLKLYLSAADVCCLFLSDDVKNYAGVGLAPLEALACGTPVVGNSIIHFPE